MIAFTKTPARAATWLTGALAVTAGLAGCSQATAVSEPRQTSNYVSGSNESGAVSDPSLDTSATYADGTYTATGTYNAPRGPETIGVTLTLADDTIAAVEVTPDAVVANSVIFQGKFAGAIAEAAVGVDIDSLAIDRLAGSSLTGAGFMDAIATIRNEAAK